MTSWDWAFWTAGGAIALAGLLLCAWSLLHDRPRGRRRCPKCWYDMSALPGLKCPECGREARTEKRLFRTRRRWRWAALGAVLLALAAGTAATPVIASGNWVGYTPIPLLNLVLSFWPDEAQKQFDALTAGYPVRTVAAGGPVVTAKRLNRWQRLLAAHHAAELLHAGKGDLSDTLVGFGVAYGGIGRIETLIPSLGPEARPALPVLLVMLADADPEQRERSAMTLGQLDPDTGDIAGRAARMLRSRDENARLGSCLALENLGVSTPRTARALQRAAFHDHSARVRLAASIALIRTAPGSAWTRGLSFELGRLALLTPRSWQSSQMVALGRLTQMGPGSEATIVLLLDGASPRIRAAAAATLGVPHLDPTAYAPALAGALGDEDDSVRRAALQALARCRAPPSSCLERVVQLLRADASADVRMEAAHTAALMSDDKPRVTQALVAALRDPADMVRFTAARCLIAIRAPASIAREPLSGSLRDEAVAVRAAAREALEAIDPAR